MNTHIIIAAAAGYILGSVVSDLVDYIARKVRTRRR